MGRLLFTLGLAAGLFAPNARGADLRDVAARVVEEWRRVGAEVGRAPARFLYEDETATIPVPPAPPGMCTTVAVVGARGLSFHAKLSGAEDDPLSLDEGSRAASVAGALQIGRCEGPSVGKIVVTSEAGRGAIETVVAHSRSPVPSLRVVLPERTGGAMVPTAEPGTLPPLAPPARRADVAESRGRRDGGLVAPRETWIAGADTKGEGRITLAAGCHRVEIFATDPRTGQANRRARLDLDAMLNDDDDDTLLGRDRTDAPDAHIEACVGKETFGALTFEGAPPHSNVLVTHAAWPIPEHLPWTWGPETRGRMAGALLARHVAAPPGDAVALAQGGSGVTTVPIAIEPGGCYLAVAAVTHGHARGLGLRAVVGARQASDERGTNDEAGAVAFCAREQSRGRLEVEARGTALSWGMVLFRVESGVWGATR